MTTLEEEFENLILTAKKEINEKLNEIKQKLTEAEMISEKHGIPFHYFSNREMKNYYVPKTFKSLREKFQNEEDPDLFYDTLSNHNVCPSGDTYPGWHHSTVC